MKRIAVLIESSRSYGRGLIKGVSEYAAEQADWDLVYHESAFESSIPPWFENWQGDGILARVSNQAMLEALQQKGLPFVDLLNAFDQTSYPSVDCNHQEIASLAFEFFRHSGFSRFGFFGLEGMSFSDRRLAEFSKLCEEAGLKLFTYQDPASEASLRSRETTSHATDPPIEAWLKRLPKPIAIFCANDICGMNLARHCRALGIDIPTEVALLGVDNDPVVCQLQAPHLSSIQPDLIQQGRVAARWLDELMESTGAPHGLKLISPLEIVERHSTDVFVSQYPHVMEALRFIRNNLHLGIGTEQVAAEVGVSRSLLDRHFKQEHGHTVKQKIISLRLKRVLHLLQYSDKTLDQIATETGLSNASSVSHFVKAHTEKKAAEFRKK